MKLSQIKEILAQGNIVLTKALGQNFLHDANQLRGSWPRRADRTTIGCWKSAPVGPAYGNTPREGPRVWPSKRTGGFSILARAIRAAGNLELVPMTLWRICGLRIATGRMESGSHLPYSVACLPRRIGAGGERPRRMSLPCNGSCPSLNGQPGRRRLRCLTLLVQLNYRQRDGLKFRPPASFRSPRWFRVCYAHSPSEPMIAATQIETFRSIVKRSFSQRRKMMFKLLKEDWPRTSSKIFPEAEPFMKSAPRNQPRQFVNLTLCCILTAEAEGRFGQIHFCR